MEASALLQLGIMFPEMVDAKQWFAEGIEGLCMRLPTALTMMGRTWSTLPSTIWCRHCVSSGDSIVHQKRYSYSSVCDDVTRTKCGRYGHDRRLQHTDDRGCRSNQFVNENCRPLNLRGRTWAFSGWFEWIESILRFTGEPHRRKDFCILPVESWWRGSRNNWISSSMNREFIAWERVDW